MTMLFTRKGDNGQTGTFGCNQKISKSSAITEALGSLDEANSYIGVVKSAIQDSRPNDGSVGQARFKIYDEEINPILLKVQNDLFIIQAQVAGADKKIETEKITWLEEIVNGIEKQLPPIKTFMIPGANEISAHFDFARTLVRRAERRTVAVSEENLAIISPETLSYLNRLSSLMYAYARFTAQETGKKENSPTY